MSIQRSTERSPAGSYVKDEIVVALPYAGLVHRTLERWGGGPSIADEDRDDRLGLARTTLSAADIVGYLHAAHPTWVAQAVDAAAGDGYTPSQLDIVMRCLRRHFATEYNGWVPEFGKNRIVSRAHGSYVIDGGGGGGPVAQPAYVIDGGGDGGPVAQPAYVIDGGGDGAPVAQPAYVIDGGGQGVAPTADPIRVSIRRVSPGTGVRVGVVDTKAAPNPWLAGGFVAPAEDLLLLGHGSDGAPIVEHGTFVVGLVLRQAPGATVVLRQGLDDEATQDSWTLARTVARLAESSTEVVNLSLGCLTDDDQPPLVLTAALAALGPRTVVVAAAGNHGTGLQGGCPKPAWPAALDSVIAVGAVDTALEPAPFSPQAPWVDAVSQGVDVVSTTVPSLRGSLFASWSGTSFAAAAVSGAIAAGIRNGVDGHAAWTRLQETSAQDDSARPIVPLRALPTRRGT